MKITDDWITDMCIWAVATDIYEDDEDDTYDKIVFETTIKLEEGEEVEEILVTED